MWYLAPILIIMLTVVAVPLNSFASVAVGHLKIAQWGQHRYMVYQNLSSPTSNGTYFQESHDGGMNFSSPIDLSHDLDANGTAVVNTRNPQVGAFANDTYVIFEGKLSTGIWNLFYATSSDGGIHFENVTDVSRDVTVGVIESSLAVDRDTGDVFIAFINDDGSVVPCHVHCKG